MLALREERKVDGGGAQKEISELEERAERGSSFLEKRKREKL